MASFAQIDVVVKPLAQGLDELLMFPGATILGDGTAVLILDVECRRVTLYGDSVTRCFGLASP